MPKLALAAGVAALASFALACLATGAAAQSYSPAARQVLDRAQAASGGAAWNGLRGLHETGVQNGLRYEAWYDPLRYGARVETHEPAGRRVHAFNGIADWQMFPDGRILGYDDRITLAQARTAAFLGAHGFFYPSRFAANGTHLGVRQDGGASFDVLRVQPLGGEARELWFDRATRHLTRIVDRTGAAPVTVTLSDYRRVGPLTLAFRSTSDRAGPGRAQERQAQAITLPTADRGLFSWTLGPVPPPALPQIRGR